MLNSDGKAHSKLKFIFTTECYGIFGYNKMKTVQLLNREEV